METMTIYCPMARRGKRIMNYGFGRVLLPNESGNQSFLQSFSFRFDERVSKYLMFGKNERRKFLNFKMTLSSSSSSQVEKRIKRTCKT